MKKSKIYTIFAIMKESEFIQNNVVKWKRIEKALNSSNAFSDISPEVLADLYLDLTSDLAFSRTNYPEAKTTSYLNNLTFTFHNKIYRKERMRWEQIKHIFTHRIPLTLYESRGALFMSIIVFTIFTLFGTISQINNPNYADLVLGTSYVSTTLDNIEQGKPTDIYASSPEIDSFFMIVLNNLWVDLRTFLGGILTSLGALIFLIYNGLMLGCFQTFFFQHGVGWESVLSIWQHGALEIPTIILSGAAGITMGNGWLFPGTYSRYEAFKRSAKRGMVILAGVAPVTVVAAIIESFLTRHTEFPTPLRIMTIILGFAFIIAYFGILPFKRGKEVADE